MSNKLFLEGRAELDKKVEAFRGRWIIEDPDLRGVKKLLFTADLARYLHREGYRVEADRHDPYVLHVDYFGMVS